MGERATAGVSGKSCFGFGNAFNSPIFTVYELKTPPEPPIQEFELIYRDSNWEVYEPTWWSVYVSALHYSRQPQGFIPWRDDNTPGYTGEGSGWLRAQFGEHGNG